MGVQFLERNRTFALVLCAREAIDFIVKLREIRPVWLQLCTCEVPPLHLIPSASKKGETCCAIVCPSTNTPWLEWRVRSDSRSITSASKSPLSQHVMRATVIGISMSSRADRFSELDPNITRASTIFNLTWLASTCLAQARNELNICAPIKEVLSTNGRCPSQSAFAEQTALFELRGALRVNLVQ